MPDSYPMGARVTFADQNATVSHGKPGLVSGTVNGEAITDDEGTVLAVPVFAARDNGRESTTIFVHPSNIMGVRR
jgi:hypothetical protein